MFVGLLTIAVVVLYILLLEARQDIRELSEQLAVLQKDVMEEFSYKYGGLYGKK